MKSLILAAGYATRLYPLTENFPKPLLPIKDKPIVDWLIDDLRTSKEIDEFVIISNHKFAHHFQNWAKTKDYKVTVVDDGTSTNETRLGAVIDIKYALEQLDIKDDVLILAGDNVLDFSLTSFVNYAVSKDTSCVMRYYEPDTKSLTKRGVLELDGDTVIGLEEKPANPKSNWCCPPFYYYTKGDIARIQEAIEDGCGTDAPGSLVGWMINHSKVNSMEMPGKRYDVGNLEGYKKINEEYAGIIR